MLVNNIFLLLGEIYETKDEHTPTKKEGQDREGIRLMGCGNSASEETVSRATVSSCPQRLQHPTPDAPSAPHRNWLVDSLVQRS